MEFKDGIGEQQGLVLFLENTPGLGNESLVFDCDEQYNKLIGTEPGGKRGSVAEGEGSKP